MTSSTTLALPQEAEQLLYLLDDYSVGGSVVTPSVESYDNLRELRRPITSPEDWMHKEGVHFNPSSRSIESSYKYLGISAPTQMIDRVVVMDFDVYSKEGTLKGHETTPQLVIEKMKELVVPLPYCYSYSGTPGNFHMMWVLDKPTPRGTTGFIREVYRFWGADPNFKNSTMRNPIFRYFNPNMEGQTTHWWTEWTDSLPTISSERDLAPKGLDQTLLVPPVTRKIEDSEGASRNKVLSGDGLFRHKMTDHALESTMAKAVDADGRFFLLKSWVMRQVWKHGGGIPFQEVLALAKKGNSMFKEPMSFHRVLAIAKYWTLDKQSRHIHRQTKAGDSEHNRNLHRESLKHYFEVIDFRDMASNSSPESWPVDMRVRDSQFSGTKKAKNGSITYEYLAWMFHYEDKEIVWKSTGEIHVVTPTNQMRNMLKHGAKKGYSREAYEEVLAEEASSEAVLDNDDLTHDVEGATIYSRTSTEDPYYVSNERTCIYECVPKPSPRYRRTQRKGEDPEDSEEGARR